MMPADRLESPITHGQPKRRAGRFCLKESITKILRILALVFFCWATAVAYARASVIYARTAHEVAFGGCHFKLRDAYDGKIHVSTDGSSSVANYHTEINPKARHPFGTWIQFYCEKEGVEKAFEAMGMKYADSHWMLDKENYTPLPEEHVAIYPLRDNAWSGAGLSGEQTTGDEDQRMRSFGFCIAGAKQVLCGTIQQVMFLTSPRDSTIPQVIQLLQSIEFVDDASGVPVKAVKAPVSSH